MGEVSLLQSGLDWGGASARSMPSVSGCARSLPSVGPSRKDWARHGRRTTWAVDGSYRRRRAFHRAGANLLD